MNELYGEDLRERYYDWSLLKRVLFYLNPYRGLVLLSVTLLFGVSLLNLAGPYLTKIAIDDYIKVSNFAGLDRIAVLYVSALAGAFACQFLQTFVMQYVGQKVMFDLRAQVFSHLHRMSFGFFDRNPIGKLVTRVVNDVEVLNEMLTSGIVMVFNDLFTLAGIAVILIYLDWRLFLAVCAAFPPLLLATAIFRTQARDAMRKYRAHVSVLNSSLAENLSGMSAVQTFAREEENYRQFLDIHQKKLGEDLRALRYNSIYLPSIDVFSAMGIALVIWYGGGRFVQEEIQLGVLVAFLQYLQKFFDPVRDLAEKFNLMQSAMISSERIFELLDTPEQLPNPENPRPISRARGKVEFKNVWFAYKDDDYVLKDVSFSVEAGESLAIVGATGSGKTTIVNLLCRFYDIQKGEIFLDGIPISSMNKYDLRRQIALVQQDVFLFSGNIMDNIRLGNVALGQQEVESIAQTAHSHPFISKLPYRYEQEVREKGSLLSLGQKQLLSFARALAFDPRVLALDEATSSVDTETERLVQDALAKLVRDRTSIIIAHRLSTLKNVDKVLVLRHGQVQEFGTRRQLLENKGIFCRLYNLQMSEDLGDIPEEKRIVSP
ncbi:MAG: ABC transporter ATP-binding protein [Nitrospinae bacterium]|nr:ABC transporter ATP-binding protein [Nitrospinota bacterium]